MAKSKASKKNKNSNEKADSKQRDDGADDIRRAQKRLAKALAGVDEAREKVQRRQRDLAELMKRYGYIAPVTAAADEAIPLEAPAHSATENGATHLDAESGDIDLIDQPVEQAASTDGDERHE